MCDCKSNLVTLLICDNCVICDISPPTPIILLELIIG